MSVKALARGLQVLSAVNDLNPALVKDVVETTSLPKATVIRLLKSLVEEGYLMADPSGQGYRVTAAARKLSRALGERSRYASISEPVLSELGRRLKYPAVLSVSDGQSLVIEASNRATAPIRLQLFERSRIPMLASAAGMAYLAALSPERCAQTVESLCQNTDETSESMRTSIDAVMRELDETRNRGFASKYYPSLNDATAIALPVREGGSPIGALSLMYFESLTHAEILNGVIRPTLTRAVLRIEEQLAQNATPAPSQEPSHGASHGSSPTRPLESASAPAPCAPIQAIRTDSAA